MPTFLKKYFADKIGNKLFALFVLAVGLTITPIAYQVLESVNTFGEYSTKVTEDQIRKQVISYLSRLSSEQAHRYEEYFSKVSSLVGFLAGQASSLYSEQQVSVCAQENPATLQYQKENQMFVSAGREPVLSLYWGGDSLSSDIKSELTLLRSLDSSLIQAKKFLPETLAIHVTTASGIGKYYTKNISAFIAAHHLPRAADFDLRDGAPFTVFTRSENITTGVQWSNIYKDDVIEGLMVTASGPVLDARGQLQGIVGVDLPLDTIIRQILEPDQLLQGDEGEILFSFLMNKDGIIIAYPLELLSLFGIDPSLPTLEHSEDTLEYNLSRSTDPEVQELIANILQTDSSVVEFVLQGEKHHIASQTLTPHGWKLVMVAREVDLLSPVMDSRQALDRVMSSLKVKFIFYSACLGLIILLCSYLAVKHFVSPLQKLSFLAQRVGEGDLSKKSDLDRQDELGTLSLAMNRMIDSLATAEAFKTEYLQKLRNGIIDRTVDLQKKNLQLNEVMLKVHLESEKRREVSLVLQERERQLVATMEASLAGLCIVQKNKFKYVNVAIVEMFGYSKKELIDKIGPIDLVASEYNNEVMEKMNRRGNGSYKKPFAPFHLKCRRKNGEVFDVEVNGSFLTWKGAPASVGTIVDISEHVRARKAISVNEERLKRLLEEKDILLREVYHRTKNNMLVIISMLALQIDDIEDKVARKIFEEMEHRIRAMALVHENLYQSENLVEINLGEYLAKMARTQVEHMTFSDQIQVRADYCQVAIPFDTAVPLGLVVSELITNAVKYAFPAGRKGIIRLLLREKNGALHLVVEDNGVGLPPDIDIDNASSFGFQITRNMVTKQLMGSIRVERKKGTSFHITFKVVNENG